MPGLRNIKTLLLVRFHADPETTVGRLYIRDHERDIFQCYTLEDTYRGDGEMLKTTKIPAETAIPEGVYPIVLQTDSRLMERYCERFGAVHQRGMLALRDVPCFDGVLLHCGNNQYHTEGCPLVGQTATISAEESSVGRSRRAYEDLYPSLSYHLEYHGDAVLKVINDWPREARVAPMGLHS